MSLIKVEEQFNKACTSAGLEVNGLQPHDPQVLNPSEFYQSFSRDPYMAMGECYVAKHYDVENLGEMIFRFSRAEIQGDLPDLTTRQQFNLIKRKVIKKWRNPNRRGLLGILKSRQFEIAKDHYDLDTELMELTLGPSMKYTSGYWLPEYGPFELDTSQKLDLEIAGRRMGLEEGMEVLDIGFGYGLNTKYLVDRFGVKLTGITISTEQKEYAEKICADISDKVNFVLSDWRNIHPGELGYFDRVINFEMIESIGGPKNYPNFFQFMADSLKEEGSIFMQAINGNKRTYVTNPWIDKYIFQGGVLPNLEDMMSASKKAGLHSRLVDNSLGWSNGQTINAWYENFERGGVELFAKINEEEYWRNHARRSERRRTHVGWRNDFFWLVMFDLDKFRKIYNVPVTKGDKYKFHFRSRFPYEINDESFFRMWRYYLVSTSAAHLANVMNDGHFIWEKNEENVSKPDIQVPRTREEVDLFIS